MRASRSWKPEIVTFVCENTGVHCIWLHVLTSQQHELVFSSRLSRGLQTSLTRTQLNSRWSSEKIISKWQTTEWIQKAINWITKKRLSNCFNPYMTHLTWPLRPMLTDWESDVSLSWACSHFLADCWLADVNISCPVRRATFELSRCNTRFWSST